MRCPNYLSLVTLTCELLFTDLKIHYLKDWHLVLCDDSFYECPPHFQDDWLNEFCIIENKSDYRFVYMGPADSCTPIHRDVLASHSWSTNIVGQKIWHFWAHDDISMIKAQVGTYVGVYSNTKNVFKEN